MLGLLWFDSSTDQLDKKITRAAAAYQKKFGQHPTTCILNPQTIGPSAPSQVGGLTIQTKKYILPNHIWVGIDQPTA